MARHISKNFLPEEYTFYGKKYTRDIPRSAMISMKSLSFVEAELKILNIKYIVISVMSKNLVGKTDLHHKPYEPSLWIFTHNSKTT